MLYSIHKCSFSFFLVNKTLWIGYEECLFVLIQNTILSIVHIFSLFFTFSLFLISSNISKKLFFFLLNNLDILITFAKYSSDRYNKKKYTKVWWNINYVVHTDLKPNWTNCCLIENSYIRFNGKYCIVSFFIVFI